MSTVPSQMLVRSNIPSTHGGSSGEVARVPAHEDVRGVDGATPAYDVSPALGSWPHSLMVDRAAVEVAVIS